MSEISFEDNNNSFKYRSRVILGMPEVPKMTRFLIGKGVVKNEKQAQGFLFITTILFLCASIYIFAVYVFGIQLFNKTPTITPEQIQTNKERIQQFRQQKQNNANSTEGAQ